MAITSLIVKIGAQDQGLQKALEAMGQQADAAQRELARLGKTPVSQEAVKSIEAIDKATKAVTDDLQKMADRSMNMARGINIIGDASKFTSDQLDQMSRSLSKGADAFRALGTTAPVEFTKATNAINAQQRALKDASGEAQTLTTRMVAVGAAIGTFAGNIAADAFRRIGSAMIGVVSDAFKMNASLETTTLKFTTLMKDSDKASAHVKELFEIAKKTPFETGPIIEASLKLQTFGGAALNTKDNILRLGDASAATGAPINELGFWVGRLYSNLQAGKPFGEAAMRLQELAVLSPEARDQMEALQKSGKSASEIFDIFKDSLGRFTGAMETQAGTWEGVMSTFTDTVNMMMADTLKPYFEVIRDLGKNVNKALDGMSASMDGAAAATARTKQAFADFVVGSLSATVKGISFLMVEFNAAQKVFGNVAQVIQGVALAFEYAALGVAKLLNIASFGKAFNDDLKRIDATIGNLLVTMSKRGAALQADTADQKDWIEWGNKSVAMVSEMTKNIGSASTVVAVHGKAVEQTATKVERLTASNKSASESAKKFRTEVESLVPKVLALEGGLFQVPDALQKIGRGYDESKLSSLADAVAKVEQSSRIANFGFSGMTDALKGVGIEARKAGDELDNFARFEFSGPINQVQSFGKTMADVLKGVPQMVANAFTGGGGILGALKGIGSQLGSTIGERIAKTVANLSGIGGPIGAAIGSLAGPLIGMFAKMFSSAEKQINPLRQTFVDMAGGLDALNRKAAAAGVTLTAMLNAKNPEQYKKAIEDLNAAFQFQADALAVLDETAKRYGFTIEELGPAMARQELDKQAQGLFKDWQVLNAAGIDTVAITSRMAESVNAYVKTATKMGVEVPAAMKPMLQAMIDQGLLTDAAGNKIENLEDSGITFAQTMSEGFKSVVDEVKKLAEAITRSLGGAITGLPTHKEISIGFDVEEIQIPGGNRERDFAARGGLVTETGIQRFASGGRVLPFLRRGTDTVPAMLTPGEIVLNEAQQQAVGQAIGGGGTDLSGLRLDIAGLRSDLARDRADAPRRNARALTAALQTAGLRK